MPKLSQLLLISIGSLTFLAAVPAKAQIITKWSFNSTVAAPDNSPAASTGTGTASSLGMTNTYTYASTTATNSVTSDDITSVTGATSALSEDTWRVRGAYVATGTSPNIGSPSNKANVNGWNTAAAQYSQGVEFDASTVGYQNINVSFDWFSTTQGVRDLQFQYTTNGTTWVNFGGTSSTGTYIANPSDFYGGTTGTTPSISLNLSSIAGANNDASFGIRMVSAFDSTGHTSSYASATLSSGLTTAINNSSGNWSFDNVTISGQAVPEPSSYVLGLGAVAMFFGLKLRRRICSRD